jgi:hypothetical protein
MYTLQYGSIWYAVQFICIVWSYSNLSTGCIQNLVTPHDVGKLNSVLKIYLSILFHEEVRKSTIQREVSANSAGRENSMVVERVSRVEVRRRSSLPCRKTDRVQRIQHNFKGSIMSTDKNSSKVVVSFRGQKIGLEASPDLTVGKLKSRVASAADNSIQLSPSNVKLIFKGKVLSEDEDLVVNIFGNKPAKIYRLMATGVSAAEQAENQQQFEEGLKTAPRIRDDLTKEGQQETIRHSRMGRAMLQKAAAKSSDSHKFGFGRIETLPNLPDETKAKGILATLAKDPGVLACMAKHEWNVGSLAELYPEGKVGESDVCVMGLNQNNGQKILLRIRTDDVKGFRKMLSIRKVLFHELAHNVHSEHNQDFFQLMRQIERECNEMDWTQGSGTTTAIEVEQAYEAGSYRLGGDRNSNLSVRELAGRAAVMRLTDEEQDIYDNCGCGREAKFLPFGGGSSNDH